MLKARTWFDALHLCQQQGQSYVLVTLLASAGSTPRDGGSKMLICDDQTYDTIGGGNLEYRVTHRARELLAAAQAKPHNSPQNSQQLEYFPLSSKLGQCCGGATNVLFEVFVSHCQQLALYGAGHVAQALVPIIMHLPLQIYWVDERAELFSEFRLKQPEIGSNVKTVHSDDPLETVAKLKAKAWMLVMTHNHQLDFELVSAGLKRPDIDYLGMIGSHTKARRFTTRLSHQGFAAANIARLISPVGLLDIPGKEPINVAVSIAAQLMQRLQSPAATQTNSAALNKQQWQTNRQLISLLESKQ